MSEPRSPEWQAFVDQARDVRVMEAFERAGYSTASLRNVGGELVGPCPSCGGRDRFALNAQKNSFFCRNIDGGDPIKMVQHLTGEDFLGACEILTGQARPDHLRIDPQERARARARWEADRAEARRAIAEEDAKRQADDNHFRAAELERCLRIWDDAKPGGLALEYLVARGLRVDALDPRMLRTHRCLSFFHKPEKGAARAIFQGPAMIARFVTPGESAWRAIGIHLTWLDLARAPKFRPEIFDPETGEILPTKKMRGSKLGGLIPLIGRVSTARRMVSGEGIETTLGFARFDGFRADTFYCAAGDLGNLCGKADAKSRIRHPILKRQTKRGTKPVLVPGTTPDMDSVCLPVPEHIEELVLLGDGDSDPVMTRAALERGQKRHAREGRIVRGLFAPAGGDWADVRIEDDA